MWPGQRTNAGTRKAPSQFVSFSDRNGVVAASGHVNWFGPLSVVKTTMVLSAIFRSSRALSSLPTFIVHLEHAVGVLVAGHAALPAHGFANVREDVHAREVHPGEERLAGLDLPAHEVDAGGRRLVVDGFHALAVQRAGVLDRLFTDVTPVLLIGRVVFVGALLRSTPRGEFISTNALSSFGQ